MDEPFAPLLHGFSQLDRVHVWRGADRNPLGIGRLVRGIRSEHYGISIDPQGLTRSAILPFLAGIPVRVGFSPASLEGRELAPLFTNRRVSPPDELSHVSVRSLYLGRALELDMPHHMPVPFPRDPKADAKIRHWWKESRLNEKRTIFGIGAGWLTKMWAVEEMAALVEEARDHGYASVILWGPSE